MGSIFSGILDFFGGSVSSSVVVGLVLCLLAALGLAECRQSKIEDLNQQVGTLETALEASNRSNDTLRDELKKRDEILLRREGEREEARNQLEADKAEAARVGGDWLDLPVPADVLRLLRSENSPAGGHGKTDPPGPADAGNGNARFAWEH